MDSLKVLARSTSIRAVGKFVLEAAAAAGLDEPAAYRLRLAVDEIATNAVEHGYQPAGHEGYLLVSANFDKTKLTIILEDSSPNFDPLSMPPPADLEWETVDRPAGGLGIFLALQGVDEFQHQWLQERNQNRFVQYINQ